jgi:hypothetical protein
LGPLTVHKLQLTSKVKCLGLALDRELTWKGQLKNVMNEASGLSRPVRSHLVHCGSPTRVVALDLYHGNETCSDLWLSDLVAEDQM